MANDVAGPMLGWSLGAGVQQKRIHDMVTFPCRFRFTAVAKAGSCNDLIARVVAVIGREVAAQETTVRQSAQGAYESITLELWVTHGDEVYAIYTAMQNDPRVKYLL